LSQIASEWAFPLDAAQLAQWKRRRMRVGAAPDTGVGPHSVPDPAAEISRLRRENDRLRMERDILKKLGHLLEPPNEVPLDRGHQGVWLVGSCAMR